MYDVLTNQLQVLVTYWCHVCWLRFRRDNLETMRPLSQRFKEHTGYIYQRESPYREQRPGILSACHLQPNYPTKIWTNTCVTKTCKWLVETLYVSKDMLQIKLISYNIVTNDIQGVLRVYIPVRHSSALTCKDTATCVHSRNAWTSSAFI